MTEAIKCCGEIPELDFQGPVLGFFAQCKICKYRVFVGSGVDIDIDDAMQKWNESMKAKEKAKQHTEQPLPTPGVVDVAPLVIEDMKARMQVGIERYGRPLQTFNGRDSSRDAYEEILDLAVYHRQMVEEMKVLRAENEELKRRVQSMHTVNVNDVYSA